MKKFLCIISLIVLILTMAGCGDKSSRNPDYDYGTYQDEIETVFELTGKSAQYNVNDYSEGADEGFVGSFFIQVSETTTGGVVAYGEGLYVYSDDEEDFQSVKNALVRELLSK